jgi:xylan 1,4-beta-xylosidase
MARRPSQLLAGTGAAAPKLHLKIVNDRNIVTFFYSLDGKAWTRHGIRSEVSGYQANTVDDLARCARRFTPAAVLMGRARCAFRPIASAL